MYPIRTGSLVHRALAEAAGLVYAGVTKATAVRRLSQEVLCVNGHGYTCCPEEVELDCEGDPFALDAVGFRVALDVYLREADL